MGLQVGIVGLPNVGKSTLFNAVSAANAEAANYPFATIEPNVGVVPVPDARLDTLASMSKSAETIPTAVEFRDIAGLVRGASKGEGLGNQFLSHIREVDAIIHVVRCFEDPDVVHVHGAVDPATDIEVVQTELLIKDLETVQKRADRATRNVRVGASSGAAAEAELFTALREHLERGDSAHSFRRTADQEPLMRELALLTDKPILYVANVAESDLPEAKDNAHVDAVRGYAEREASGVVVLCAEAEAQIAQLEPEERAEFLSDLGLQRSGLEALVETTYALLGLISYFTTGPKETRAWTIHRGDTAPRAAGAIHSDFEKGFIRAAVVSYDDFVTHGGEQGAKEVGRLRMEGRDYVMADGDVVHFHFSS